jgi:hypothetical protein
VDGTLSEFEIDSRDCPFLLKPGQATRVRSIPFSFLMNRPNLPGSFVSKHGRAKLEYMLAVTTVAKQAKHTSTAVFCLLPSEVTHIQTRQHSFNVDVDRGGVILPLAVSAQHLITVRASCFAKTDLRQVAYPSHMLPESSQNLIISFPDASFSFEDARVTLNSKLSVHAVKSTFTIEEETQQIPFSVQDNGTSRKILTMTVPSDIKESVTMTLKRSVMRKSETLHLVCSYGVRKTPETTVHCTVTNF